MEVKRKGRSLVTRVDITIVRNEKIKITIQGGEAGVGNTNMKTNDAQGEEAEVGKIGTKVVSYGLGEAGVGEIEIMVKDGLGGEVGVPKCKPSTRTANELYDSSDNVVGISLADSILSLWKTY